MSKELKISNVLDKHLSPIQIDGANVPIEVSTDAVRFSQNATFQKDLIIEGDLSVLGATTEINMTEGVLLESQTNAGYLTFTALGFSLLASAYSGSDGDQSDNDAFITLHSSVGYDAAIKLYNASGLIWSIGKDGDDSSKLKYDFNAGTGEATKLELDTSGNSKQEGSISIKEKASAIADTAGYGQLWVKTATPNELYFTTDAGDDIQLTDGTSAAGGGGGGSSTAYWHQIVSGYRNNNTSTTNYYTFYRVWYEFWGNVDNDPSTIIDQDTYSTFFIAPRAGTITNLKVQGYAADTGATDPFKFYFYKGAMSNNADTMSLTSMGDSGAITPPANGKTFSHTVDFSSDNAFSEDDCLYVWLKKDSNSGNQDLYFTLNVSGEYS
tara:strand:+ start:435 stop:1580 length:1146 start_codon:yes stop_codon:yes gene_type:complete